MSKALIAVGVLVMMVVVGFMVGGRSPDNEARLQSANEGTTSPAVSEDESDVAENEDNSDIATTESGLTLDPTLIYGRVLTDDGQTFEGRLRFRVVEEALWGHSFNAWKENNPWTEHVAPEELTEREKVAVFGLELARRDRQIDIRRPFMARFGDLARIETTGNRDLRVVLKSGTVVALDRMNSDDFGDGVRVWDPERGTTDLGERRIRSIEFLNSPFAASADTPLFGTLHTQLGDQFTGLIQWDREAALASDEFIAKTKDGRVTMPFGAIRTIIRASENGSTVIQEDGTETEVFGTSAAGRRNRGIHVDDLRFGRVLVAWDDFARVDFSEGTAPTFDDFPVGSPIVGTVITKAGDEFAGQLVYDLDESETTDTLDAEWKGVDYTIPFGLIASIRLSGDAEPAQLSLHNGVALQLDRTGDLRVETAGVLVLTEDGEPTYVQWADVSQIRLDEPTAAYPPLDLGFVLQQ